MFTGIIEGVGRITSVRRAQKDICVDVDTGGLIRDAKTGESVALDGVCLTVVKIADSILTFDISVETINRSTFKNLKTGDKVNMERAMRMGDRLGGHLVSGHVDCVGRLSTISASGEGYEIEIALNSDGMKYVIEKGSIAISGMSLTVASKLAQSITVAIIPHTWEVTTLKGMSIGSPVNIEYDMMGKYVESFINAIAPSGERITKQFLDQNGF